MCLYYLILIYETWNTIIHSSNIDDLELYTKYWPWPIPGENLVPGFPVGKWSTDGRHGMTSTDSFSENWTLKNLETLLGSCWVSEVLCQPWHALTYLQPLQPTFWDGFWTDWTLQDKVIFGKGIFYFGGNRGRGQVDPRVDGPLDRWTRAREIPSLGERGAK